MPKIKHTKNELKNQRDELRRYERFLPTLELKKQQLQLEVRKVSAALDENQLEEKKIRGELEGWVRLFAEAGELGAHLRVRDVRHAAGNIAGVAIPVLQEIIFEHKPVDLFRTPAWFDDGLERLERLVRLRISRMFLEAQQRLLGEELRTTTQRVNLFEKVKIPTCSENIRVIRIFLGDDQIAAVARAKIAKAKTVAGGQAA